MLASSMASRSATNPIVTGILAKDLYQGYLDPAATDRRMLAVSRGSSLVVGVFMIACALVFSSGAKSVFTLLFIFESIFLVPLGLPMLYGLLVPWGPWWCALFAYTVGATSALGVNLYLNEGGVAHLNETHMIGIPAITTTLAFWIPALLLRSAKPAEGVAGFFVRLATPIDPTTELGEASLSGRRQLALVGRVTMGIGLASFLLLLAEPDGRSVLIVALYGLATTLCGAAFVFAGRTKEPTGVDRHEEREVASIARR